MNKMRIIIGILFFSVVYCANQQDDLCFTYGVLGRLQSQDEKITVLQDSSMIHTGDSVRINVGYVKGTHLYVLYHGSEGEYMLLYPEGSLLDDNLNDLPDTTYATVLHWSQFSDPIGFETFYLINSSIVLEDLLTLLERYDRINAKGKIKLAKKIQNELDKLDPETKQDLASIATRLDKPVLG